MKFKLRIQAKQRIENENRKLLRAIENLTPWASNLPINPLSEELEILCRRSIQQAAKCFADYSRKIREIPGELRSEGCIISGS